MARVNYNDPDMDDAFDDARYGVIVDGKTWDASFLYSQPDCCSSTICRVYPDTQVEIVNEQEDWFYVTLSIGTSGWIQKIYVNAE